MKKIFLLLVFASSLFHARAANVVTDKYEYSVGEKITVKFSGSVSVSDWVGIFKTGTEIKSENQIRKLYTGGKSIASETLITGGEVIFESMPEGNYTAYLFSNNSFTVSASAGFSVKSVKTAANTFLRWGSTGNPLTGLTVTWKNIGTADQIKWGYTTSYENGTFSAVKRAAYSGNFFDYTFPTVTPSTTIHYQIYNSAIASWSVDQTYNTATASASTQFSFVALGDSRDGMATWTAVTNKALAENTDFGIFTGDVVANSATGSLWDAWFTAGSPFLSQKLMYYCEGNHDGNSIGNEATYLSQFTLPSNKQYYSFSYGNAVFICMNTENPGDATQLAWLKTTLAANSTKTWKIMFLHKPFFSIGPHGADMTSYLGTIWKAFDDYGVDIILNGHDHMYERSKPINRNVSTTAPVANYGSGAAEGRCEIVCGGSGAPLYTGTITNMLQTYSSNYHYCKFDVNGNSMTVTTKKSDGTLIETFTLTKSSTGTGDINQKFNDINVIPSPTKGAFKLKYNSEQIGEAKILVFNMLGQVVFSKKVQKSQYDLEIQIDLSQLPKGVYSAEISVGDQKDNALIVLH
jgi:hypothetical protein